MSFRTSLINIKHSIKEYLNFINQASKFIYQAQNFINEDKRLIRASQKFNIKFTNKPNPPAPFPQREGGEIKASLFAG
ncbi:PAS domain S-box/diguanylate cyclase GGDEF domain-containing protein [Nostoc cycadae WK-1]|uniref:PAS domain S-box/diguanylate cyclase GGDEF domain-containing protein n=1 Tax=Nostoc cycadae WK-1 TaxID=1861711 RepID=A0A2H6LDV9_9NOSO|nr:PAS domain S-box/diguanylate cyclase GGDEF domain-containing protein [Nostoc cycadae WK-1]